MRRTTLGTLLPMLGMLLAALLSLPPCALAQDSDFSEAGTLLFGSGDFQVVRDLKALPAPSGTPLAVNDTLRAPIGARIKAVLIDDSVVMLWEDAEARLQTVTLDIVGGRRTIEVEQVTGNLRLVATAFIAEQDNVSIRTPSAVITLGAGADVVVHHSPANDQSEVVALAGTAQVRHLFGEFPETVTLEPLQTSVVPIGQAPSAPVFMDRTALDVLHTELQWRLPQPVPDWDAMFAAHLDSLADRGFGRVRRSVSRPLTPAWGVTEGLIDQTVPDRPGSVSPTPRSTLTVEFGFGDVQEAP